MRLSIWTKRLSLIVEGMPSLLWGEKGMKMEMEMADELFR